MQQFNIGIGRSVLLLFLLLLNFSERTWTVVWTIQTLTKDCEQLNLLLNWFFVVVELRLLWFFLILLQGFGCFLGSEGANGLLGSMTMTCIWALI